MKLIDYIPDSWYSEDAQNIRTVLDGCQKIYDIILEEIHKFNDGLNVNTAHGAYLEMNGQDYGIIKNIGEDDESYRLRIQNEMLKQRLTINSIKTELSNIFSSQQNTIYEPWTNLFNVGESTLSGPDRIPDYRYWDYHVIDVETPIELLGLDQLLNKLLSAGKTLYISIIKNYYIRVMQEPNIISQIDGEISDICLSTAKIYHNCTVDTIIDYSFRSVRYLYWSPCMSVDNPYEFTDGVEVPHLQLGWKVITEIKGVDF